MPEPDIRMVESSRYFTRRELVCRCGCDDAAMDAEFMRKADEMRAIVGVALFPSSGKRCANHNAKVSSTGRNGPHTTGHSIDIRCSHALAHKVMAAALQVGMTGVGVSQKGDHRKRFIHLDDLPRSDRQPRPHIWSYP